MPILNRTLELVSETTGVEPVSLAELRDHLRDPSTSENSYIQSLGILARRQVEANTRRKFVKGTYRLKLHCFPSSGPLQLEKPTVASVTSVTYQTSTGTVAVSTGVYELDAQETPGYLRLRFNQEWPQNVRDIHNAVTVNFVSGSTSAADTPDAAKHAIKLLVDTYYCDRGITGPGQSMAYDTLIGMLRWGDYR